MAGDLIRDLIARIQNPEDLELEFKRAGSGLPKSLWPTVSAFANTRGGWIILGIDDSGDEAEVTGVQNVEIRMQELWDLLRNPQKVSMCPCGPEDVQRVMLHGRDLLLVRVRAAERKQKPFYVNDNPYRGTYVRGHAGDHLCTREEVHRMMREASDVAPDSTVLTHFDARAIETAALQRYRRMFATQRPEHPFNDYDDLAFLRAVEAWGTERESGQDGPTVAGLLVLGTAAALQEWRGRHMIDFRLKSDDSERWADRLLCESGLLDAFHQIYPRLISGQPAPFRLENATRVEPAGLALREALVNLLVHADYYERDASLVTRSPEGINFRNPGYSLVPPSALLSEDRSDPRNPAVMRMFRHVALAEEAGSGLAQIVKAWRGLGFRLPRITSVTERNEFELELKYVHLISDEDRDWLRRMKRIWGESEQVAMVFARHEGAVDNASLRGMAGLHPADATKVLTALRDEGFLEKTRSGRYAAYELGPKASYQHPELSTSVDTPKVRGGQNLGGKADEPSGDKLSTKKELQEIPPSVRQDLLLMAARPRAERRMSPVAIRMAILRMCAVHPLGVQQLATLLGRSSHYLREHIRFLVDDGALKLRYPDNPSHPKQRYVAPRTEPAQATLFDPQVAPDMSNSSAEPGKA